MVDPEQFSLRDAFLSSPATIAMHEIVTGQRSESQTNAKRHHFVPQLVLRNFWLSCRFGGDSSVRERDPDAGAAEVDHRDQCFG